MSVPSNLVPTSILQLPEDPAPSNTAWMVYVNNGVTYKVQVNAVLNVSGVPSTRVVAAGTGLTGGGALSSNITISVAPGGIGATELDNTGVTPGVYGDSASYPVITVDANGRVTAASELALPSTSGFVPTSREVIAGAGLLGGGTLTSNVTLTANLSNALPLPVGTTSAGVSTSMSRADHVHPAIDLSDTTQTTGALDISRGGTGAALITPPSGGIIYSNGSQLQVSPAGISGQVLYSGGSGAPTWATISGTGTVTSVALSLPSIFSVSGSPVTTAGTLSATFTSQAQNAVFAGPTSGSGTPTFRSLVNGDLQYSAITINGNSVALGGSTTVTATATNALTIGTGLSGTSYNGSSPVTIAIANTGVSASTYGSASSVPVFAVNAQGQLTSVTNTPIAIANTAVSGLGTMSTQDSNNVNITAGTIAVTADPTTNLQVATKQYVDTLVAVGVNYHEAVYVESPDTTGNLTATYNNGTLGVGATLTNAGTQVALTIDGVLMTVGKRVLIYNQTNQFENGVYTVTTVGDGSTNWVLTRATDADSYGPGPTALDEGSAFYVTNGSTGAGETYVCSTTGTIVFGTTAITFGQVSSAQIYSAGTGLTLTGTQFSITNTGTAGTYGSASQVPVFVTNAQGQVTSVTNTSIAIANTQVSGLGTMSTQNANSVAITGGAIDGTTIGGSTAAAGTFTTVTATSYSGIDGGTF
ncbi:MAG: tail fiber protein [Caudovirales sp. ctOwN3]|nr:MAG: tail fiber protein [Caudovirales sp. ctOwN3]